MALGGGAAIAALSAALVATDPEKRRQEQMKDTGGDELEAVSVLRTQHCECLGLTASRQLVATVQRSKGTLTQRASTGGIRSTEKLMTSTKFNWTFAMGMQKL